MVTDKLRVPAAVAVVGLALFVGACSGNDGAGDPASTASHAQPTGPASSASPENPTQAATPAGSETSAKSPGGPFVTRAAPKTAEGFLHTLGKKDVDAACQMMIDDADKPMTQDSPQWEDCQSLLHMTLAGNSEGEIRELTHARVKSADVQGNKATVRGDNVSGVADPDFTVKLARIDGKWYVSDFQ